MTETKTVELVIVADHSEVACWPWGASVPLILLSHTATCHLTHPCPFFDWQVQRYPDPQRLLNRTLELALLLDTVSEIRCGHSYGP